MGRELTEIKQEWLNRAATSVLDQDRGSSHTQFLVEQLGRAIVAGTYSVHCMIPLDAEICSTYHVSRTVVREAKKTLIGKGLLKAKAKVGTCVRPPEFWNMFDEDVLRWHASVEHPAKFFDELFEIRLIFEPAAAARAAEGSEPTTALFAQCDALAAATNRADFAVADYEFHAEVLRLSGNRFLQSLGNMVQTALYALFMAEAGDSFPARQRDVATTHRAIANAIAARTPEDARAAMERVIRDGYANANTR